MISSLPTVSVFYTSLSFDIEPFFRFSVIGSQSKGVDSSQKVTKFDNRPKAKVIVGKSDRPIRRVTFIDLSTKDLLSLGQYRLFLGFRGSIHTKKI